MAPSYFKGALETNAESSAVCAEGYAFFLFFPPFSVSWARY